MDKDVREAERSGDVAGLLRARLRAGELTQAHVELAASLGHASALELCPKVELVNWSSNEVGETLETATTLLGDETLPARVASDWAERVLPLFEAVFQPCEYLPNGVLEVVNFTAEETRRRKARAAEEFPYAEATKPREAVAAARAWAACPCQEHRGAAFVFLDSRREVDELLMEFYGEDNAHNEATIHLWQEGNIVETRRVMAGRDAYEAEKAEADPAYNPKQSRYPEDETWEAVDLAFRPAVCAVEAAYKAVEAAASGSAAAVSAAAVSACESTAAVSTAVEAFVTLAVTDARSHVSAAAVSASEREWQRLRLAAYVLGEVATDESAA
jgi:hypothetical protein